MGIPLKYLYMVNGKWNAVQKAIVKQHEVWYHYQSITFKFQSSNPTKTKTKAKKKRKEKRKEKKKGNIYSQNGPST